MFSKATELYFVIFLKNAPAVYFPDFCKMFRKQFSKLLCISENVFQIRAGSLHLAAREATKNRCSRSIK